MLYIKKTVINKYKDTNEVEKSEYTLQEEFEELLDIQIFLKDMAQHYAVPGMNMVTNIHFNNSVTLNALTVTVFYQDMTTSVYFNAYKA